MKQIMMKNIHHASLNRELQILIIKRLSYWHITGDYTMDSIKKDLSREYYLRLDSDTLDFIIKNFSIEKVINKCSPEERIKGLKPEDVLACMDIEIIKNFLKINKYK